MLKKIKKALSAGGVKVTLRPPNLITPKMTSLPTTVTLINRTKEDRTVDSVLIALATVVDTKHGDSAADRPHQIHQILIEEPVTLIAGQSHAFVVDVPLTVPTVPDVPLPGAFGKLAKMVLAGQNNSEQYQILAIPRVQGFTAERTYSHELPKGVGLR